MKGAARNASLERACRGFGDRRVWAENASAILCALGVENLNAEDAKGRGGKVEINQHQDTNNKKEKRTINYIFFFGSLRLSANATGRRG